MSTDAMSTDAAIETRAPLAPAHERPAPVTWSGLEPTPVLVASAAAPWPLWCLLSTFGVAGSPHAPRFVAGPLALAATLALMVWWVHRPSGRPLGRWVVSVLGIGVMGELLANALTDMGRSGWGLSHLADLPRAVAVWLLCVLIYELAPVAAASARVTKSERRLGRADALAHALFLGAAAAAHALPPALHHAAGPLWFVSPWAAAALAVTLATARSGPARNAIVPAAGRSAPLYGLALLAWTLAGLLAVVGRGEIASAFTRHRFGVTALDGVLVLWPAIGVALSLAAALALLARAWQARSAPHGTVARQDDPEGAGATGFTLERPGRREPTWVALEGGELAVEGTTVTVLGVRRRAPGGGPFRDGAAQWRARRAWPGPPEQLAAALARRAAGWLAWAGVSFAGVCWALMLLARG